MRVSSPPLDERDDIEVEGAFVKAKLLDPVAFIGELNRKGILPREFFDRQNSLIR